MLNYAGKSIKRFKKNVYFIVYDRAKVFPVGNYERDGIIVWYGKGVYF